MVLATYHRRWRVSATPQKSARIVAAPTGDLALPVLEFVVNVTDPLPVLIKWH